MTATLLLRRKGTGVELRCNVRNSSPVRQQLAAVSFLKAASGTGDFQWPSDATFAADGRKRLHAALKRYGGLERWAAELGVPLIRRRSGPQHSDVEIRQSLRRYFVSIARGAFPRRGLREHGRRGSVAKVRHTGGGQRWASERGLPGPQPACLTKELIDREVRLLCAGKPTGRPRTQPRALCVAPTTSTPAASAPAARAQIDLRTDRPALRPPRAHSARSRRAPLVVRAPLA